MRYFSLLFGAASALFLSFNIASACFICDEVIEVDARRAACFLADYHKYIQAIETSGKGRAEIDLSGCTDEEIVTNRGVEVFPFFPGKTPDGGVPAAKVNIRSIYILDRTSAECLKNVLEHHTSPIDPFLRVNLIETCQ